MKWILNGRYNSKIGPTAPLDVLWLAFRQQMA